MTAPETSTDRGIARDRDERRVRALDEYGVLEGPRRRDLQALVTLAAQVCGVPMATLNLITATRQHQIATYGFEGEVTAREGSMCAVVLEDFEPVVLADASQDERFRDNPWVTGEAHVRFYATHQLVTPGDIAIGSLCVFDSEPRQLDGRQEAALAELADRVVDVLELELRSRQLAASVDRLRASEEELRRSNEELAGFAGQISHDLRGPLAAILSGHELLAEALRESESRGTPVPREAQWLLSRATQAGMRMTELLDGTLAYASADGRREDVEVDLGALVRQVLSDLADPLAGLELRVGHLPTVRGDAVQLRVVLQNLLGNAVKFAHPGEPARIEVSADPLGAPTPGWRICVVDHGVGARSAVDPSRSAGPEEFEQLFEAYQRGPGTTEVEGAGLGLATSKKIVLAHGGRIGLEATPGGGTTAWFELPDA